MKQWRSAEDVLAERSAGELAEWERISGGRALVTAWPPRRRRATTVSVSVVDNDSPRS